MNQQLLNPFAQDYPDAVEAAIDSTAQRCRFNKTRGTWAGHLLASGCSDGLVEVVDLDTKEAIRSFDGHVKGVESLSWSRHGRYLLSASRDWKCVVWDLFYTDQNMPPMKPRLSRRNRTRSGDQVDQTTPEATQGYPTTPMRDSVLFDTPLTHAELHPNTSRIILANTSTHEVALVYLPPSAATRRRICWLRDQTREEAREVLLEGMDGTSDAEVEEKLKESPESIEDASRLITFATFHPSGEWIYAGTSQGVLLIFDARTRWLVNRTKISTTALKQIAFDRSGKYLVINSTDRAVRVMFVDHQESLPPTEGATSTLDPTMENIGRAEVSIIPLHKFQDQVSRTPWNAVGFSGDAEYVMGGAGTKVSHNIYIWDRATGTLVKVLEGPKDSLDDCDWHPTKPIIASATSAGTLNIWQTVVVENWSAFAPGFEELEENREYEEKEDEFDIEDEDELDRRKRAEEEQHVNVLYPTKAPSTKSQTAEAEPTTTSTSVIDGESADYWQMNWPDDDDDVDFFPHLDLESEEMVEVEEDATRL